MQDPESRANASERSRLGVRIGVDVGGTFTDFMALSVDGKALCYHKVPSTPGDPAQAIVTGLVELLSSINAQPADVVYLGHGTTVATNMVIERRGCQTALLTTRGFRDVLEIGRQTRPHLYDYSQRRAEPLVSRQLRLEVEERIDADGQVLQSLNADALKAVISQLEAMQFDALAICLVHAYRNDQHEQRLAAAIRTKFPDTFISCSADVAPEFREFERTSTTVLNAYVAPRVQAYIERLQDGLRRCGVTAAPFTVQSNGGLMGVDEVKRYPVRTCLSGPAAGVVGAAQMARALALENVVTFDVGGTSTDVSLIVDGKPAVTAERDVANHTVRTPMIDVHVIGAGGGSIAYVDAAGGLKVGPHSAGAAPGPAAYNQGGQAATLTDANVVLHRLNPKALLDGAMAVNRNAAVAVIDEQIATPLGVSLEVAAQGVIEVAVAHIARAIRAVTSDRGLDPRDVTLCAYGGAGPLHAVAVAREAECGAVVIPEGPGTLCARGILTTDMRRDFVRTLMLTDLADNWQTVVAAFADLSKQAEVWFPQQKIQTANRRHDYAVDARYEGQSFEVAVSLSDANISADEFINKFHQAHTDAYGYAIPARAVTLVNCRLVAHGVVAKAEMTRSPIPTGIPAQALSAQAPRPAFSREVYIDGLGWQETPVFSRESLPVGCTLSGPVVVEEMSSTVYLGMGDEVQVDAWRNLIVTVAPARPRGSGDG